MLAAFFGIIIGLFLSLWFVAISLMLTTLFTESFVLYFRLFGKTGKKHKSEEKLKWHRDKFSIYPRVALGVDAENLSEEILRTTNVVSIIIFGLISVVFIFLIVFFMIGDQRFLQRMLLFAALDVGVTFVLILIGTIIAGVKSKNGLGTFCREKVKELRQGAAIEQIDLRVSDEVRNKATRYEKCIYLNLCGLKALWNKDFDSLNSIVREQDRNLRRTGPNSDFVYDNILIGGYYLILFYSTYVNPNYNNAVRIYNFIRPSLEADMDPNGRRVLAYYQYYILKQPELAAITLNQGIESLKIFDKAIMTEAEFKLEKRLMEELQNSMTEALNPGTFTRPVIENTYDEGLLL